MFKCVCTATNSIYFNVRKISIASMENYIQDKYYINGKLRPTKTTFPVYNPYTGKLLGNAANCEKAETLDAIQVAKESFKTWKTTTAKKRSSILKAWFELINKHRNVLAQLVTSENGKPINEALAEIDYAASFTEWFAEESRRGYGITIQSPHPDRRMMSIKQPIGVAGMITPWNFPSAMITRKAAAAIAAGCTVVLKPAEDTPYSAIALAMLAEEAGLPAGVLNILPCSRENAQQVGQVISSHPDIAAFSFTGSTHTGKLLLKQAADTVKKVSLELGGLSPFIVFDSVDIDQAVEGALKCKFRFMGQTCVSANVFFIQEEVHDEFVERLAKRMNEQLKSGDPMNATNTVGPLVNKKALDKVEDQVRDAINLGGNIVTGGKRGKEGGTFYEPTLITGTTSNMKCTTEETFGPIAPVYKFVTEEEVIELANKSRVGLAGYVYSSDISQCWRVAESLEVGMVGINESLLSSCEAPIGGVKESGLGREGSSNGLDEFMETKFLCHGV